MSPAANISNIASPGFSPLCCVYPPQILQGAYNNTIIGSSIAVTVGSFYGARNNINSSCSQFCTPDILLPQGYSNSLSGGLSKAKLGDRIGDKGGTIIGVNSNLLLL